MRIVFAGTPDFALAPLEVLLAAPQEIVGVYTQPDRPAGRGRRLRPSPVKALAERAGVAVHQPKTLREDAAVETLAALRPDLLVVVAYGLILPEPVLALPRYGCWNIHASLLPRWRGAAPIQRAILAGDERTGVCLMQMDAGLDTGPVLARRETPIEASDSAASLHDRLSRLGAELLRECLPQVGSLQAEAQPQTGASYARKIDRAEAELDWTAPAAQLWRAIRAFDPFPGARGELAGLALKFWRAELMPADEGRAEVDQRVPGRILQADAEGIVVATGAGALRLTELQAPGRRRMSAAEFLNAHQHLVP